MENRFIRADDVAQELNVSKPYLEALKIAPQKVKEFISGILEKFKKQEKSIYYESIPAPKARSQEREKRSKNKAYER